jgi:transposase
MPWMLMSCGKCGHIDDIDAFCSTPIYGELTRGTYQCPACGIAIQLRISGPGTLSPSGLYVPGSVELVEVQSRL